MSAPTCIIHRDRPAVAMWLHETQLDYGQPAIPLCQTSLDHWFDNADEDPHLEPIRVTWLDGSRVLGEGLVR